MNLSQFKRAQNNQREPIGFLTAPYKLPLGLPYRRT